VPLSARERAEGEEEPEAEDQDGDLDLASDRTADEGDAAAERVDNLVEGAIERK
jgi:hypothetical protein